MTKNNFVSVGSVIFLIIGVLHVLRLLYGWQAQIGDFVVPMWVSWAAVIIAFYLAYQGYWLSKRG